MHSRRKGGIKKILTGYPQLGGELLKIIAWVVLIERVLAAIVVPFFFGTELGQIRAGTWLTGLIRTALIIPLCLKVLGFF